jgi:hypothetical protein
LVHASAVSPSLNLQYLDIKVLRSRGPLPKRLIVEERLPGRAIANYVTYDL